MEQQKHGVSLEGIVDQMVQSLIGLKQEIYIRNVKIDELQKEIEALKAKKKG